MIKKLYSDKFRKKLMEHIVRGEISLGRILGLKKAKIIHYPLSPKRFTDVREIFDQTSEEDAELIQFYQPIYDLGQSKFQKAMYVAQAVNKRIRYIRDIDNPAFKIAEYWDSPINVHRSRFGDDCDGYAVLITKVLLLCGFQPYDIFTSVGYVKTPLGREGGKHAYCIVLDDASMTYYPLEGSFFSNLSISEFAQKKYPLIPIAGNKTNHPRYYKPEWITNEHHSFANNKWFNFKLVK